MTKTQSTQTIPTTTRILTDGRHLTINPYGWAIIDGDGQAGSQEVRDEAWRIWGDWMKSR